PAPEADEHFERLRHWGFNCLRFLVTWEAIEHAGPGLYDLVYLDYLQKMVAKAGEYGFHVFIDPHQDVWSRWTGGDGAPAWTLEAAGFDITKLHKTGAAFLHQEHGDPFPTMRWVSNYNKLGAATMFSLFFAGNDLAPQTKVDGVPIQEYLQSHYFNAIKKVAELVKEMPHVMGYDSLNEPHPGWIGREDLTVSGALAPSGQDPTPFQSMLLGAGLAQEVPVVELGVTGVKTLYTAIVNHEQERVWRDGYAGVWRENQVWDLDGEGEPRLLRPRHFAEVNGRAIDFVDDYYRPFVERFAREIRSVHPSAIVFTEEPLTCELPDVQALPNVVNAGHWYDAMTLFMRRYVAQVAIDSKARRPIFGKGAIDKSFAKQLGEIKQHGREKCGGPSLLGEFGIAYDLDDKIGFSEDNFASHIAAMDRTWRA
ncbi:MAG: cellulase family glycosylhydrolase, partial [Anaerolineales bacterium]|nr:cellulase family glycosylhydrolase [Anaerolineales bacterium]